MLDKRGYRPNVGIILINKSNQVFWGKRKGENSWQFPQGGVAFNETLEECLFRELFEELGLTKKQVRIIASTDDWLFYDVPGYLSKQKPHYRGQKQIWYLLRLTAQDAAINLKAYKEPEFDAWRWISYFDPIELVVKFKREVYIKALHQLASYLNKK